LWISYTSISDKSLSELKGMKTLKFLSLDGTDINDESVNLLSQLHYVKELHVGNTKMSMRGVAALQKALPGCVVYPIIR
ncbi:MAG: hypothetical protein ACRELG_28195, partial [Gemmataceae bacterium]